jgi:uncharacterized protein YbjT (DUF2867 family)
MNVVLFGATGMVGQGVLRECLLDADVERVLIVVRKSTGRPHEKIRELVHHDFLDFSSVENELRGYDACFYCLGIASAGLAEAEYSRVTHDFTIAAATTLARVNPGMTFIFVSGAGANASSRVMWSRVKGRTENDVLGLPFAASFVFRPNLIQPLHGATSRTTLYRVFYRVLGPVMPLFVKAFPKYVTTTERIGRAMLGIAKRGAMKRILDPIDINAAAG